jgi:glutamate carboxypeptidase
MGLSELERQVCAAVSKRESAMRADLAAHVAIPTGGNHAAGLDAYRGIVAQRLTRLGAALEVVPGDPRPEWLELPAEGAARTRSGPSSPRPSGPASPARSSDPADHGVPSVLIARGPRAGGASSPRVLIVGHLDTVHDPLGPFQTLTITEGGKTATGPGAVDMKGGIVIALAALEALAECGVPVNWTVLFNSDEETGSFHSIAALQGAARDHDVGLVLEPALPDGSLVVERMGSGQFKIEVFGRAAHVGRDFERGVSAVARLAEVITALGALADPARGVIVNVGPLLGGVVTNAVPDYAACWGNVRFKDESAALALEARFAALATSADAMPRVVAHRLFNRPAKPLTPAVQTLAESARAVAEDLGQKLPFGKTGGVCDGNILQDAGLPTIDTLGVRGGNLQRPDEFIELASLVERAQLLAVLLARVAKT